MDQNIVKPEQRGPLPLAVQKPEYMFPELQGLPDEFRRLAAEARATLTQSAFKNCPCLKEGCVNRAEAFEQAAQMLEEKLNG